MVDTLVSGASASRHVGSSPIIRTNKEANPDVKLTLKLASFLLLSKPSQNKNSLFRAEEAIFVLSQHVNVPFCADECR